MAVTILIDRAPGSWSMPESALNADDSTTAYTGP